MKLLRLFLHFRFLRFGKQSASLTATTHITGCRDEGIQEAKARILHGARQNRPHDTAYTIGGKEEPIVDPTFSDPNESAQLTLGTMQSCRRS